MEEFEFLDEDYVCSNCKYYGCDRSKNCETICDKWTISELILEELLEERRNRRASIRKTCVCGIDWCVYFNLLLFSCSRLKN